MQEEDLPELRKKLINFIDDPVQAARIAQFTDDQLLPFYYDLIESNAYGRYVWSLKFENDDDDSDERLEEIIQKCQKTYEENKEFADNLDSDSEYLKRKGYILDENGDIDISTFGLSMQLRMQSKSLEEMNITTDDSDESANTPSSTSEIEISPSNEEIPQIETILPMDDNLIISDDEDMDLEVNGKVLLLMMVV